MFWKATPGLQQFWRRALRDDSTTLPVALHAKVPGALYTQQPNTSGPVVGPCDTNNAVAAPPKSV